MADRPIEVPDPTDDLDSAMSSAGRSAFHVDVIDSLAAAEPAWRELETPPHLSTPYQRFDFQSAWFNTVGVAEGCRPLIVVLRDDAGAALLLLPLIVSQRRGLQIASYFGGSHINLNMPLMQRRFAERATRDDVEAIIDRLHIAAPQVDILDLERQPVEWEGVTNPMTLLPGQPSPTLCPLLIVEPGEDPSIRISTSYRRRLRSKERKLQALPGYRYIRADDDETAQRLLEAFLTMKRQHMAEQKLPDIFGDPSVAEFIKKLATTRIDQGRYAIEVHAIECDDEVIAISANVANQFCSSVMFGTYTNSENAKFSPGVILMRYMIDDYAERNIPTIDFGIGDDEYKRQFCRRDRVITDSYIALTSRGRLGVMTLSGLARAKGLIKQSPALRKLGSRIRYMIKG